MSITVQQNPSWQLSLAQLSPSLLTFYAKMAIKWPFRHKNTFFYFFATDSKQARKVKIANVGPRENGRWIWKSYSHLLKTQNVAHFLSSFSRKWSMNLTFCDEKHTSSPQSYIFNNKKIPFSHQKSNIYLRQNCSYGKAACPPVPWTDRTVHEQPTRYDLRIVFAKNRGGGKISKMSVFPRSGGCHQISVFPQN